MNLKGNYAYKNYECDLCKKIYSGCLKEQLEIAKSYNENMEIRKKLMKSEVSD